MARGIKFDSAKLGVARKVLLGAPLLATLLFCFGFVLFSPQPIHGSQPISASKPTLMVSTPQSKLSGVKPQVQPKLSTIEQNGDSSLSNVLKATQTGSPQNGHSNLQAESNRSDNADFQQLLHQVKKLSDD